ncbi:Serine transporter YbeC [Commensalibacter communis]|uniref:APC family permease n=1 Tax=Commensalibacter communis TaxID=2972786 RepID=UPI0022FF90A1|nr:APC family permease [Commensalibacter communis]CAI3922221.1 Serine transporter YbeC [Commensalibacter communis]CAI3937490.1 Serine transporter YbeC [Commensalibacter communis]
MNKHSKHFKKSLSLLDLMMIGLGSIFGSGWLLAASHVSTIAGPAGILSWVIGGFAVLLLGFIFCELGAALPHAGGVVSYPAYSHGSVVGFLTGLITIIAYSSLISIEAIAARQYASAWFPFLSANSAGDATLIGWIIQAVLLAGMFYLNLVGVKTFAKVNNILSVFKFIVPTLIIVCLLYFSSSANFTSAGFAPFGSKGIEEAISTGGVIFAYLGLTPIVAAAAEVKNPQRSIPYALVGCIVLSTIIYVLLQASFIGSIPSSYINHGWGSISSSFVLPFHDIALILGIGWLAKLVVVDAIISPSGTGNIYMNTTSRVIFAWAKDGSFFSKFAHVDEKSGVPTPALWLTFALSIFWTLPFPSWKALIGVVSSALMLSYALAPISAASLRKTSAQIERPFYLKGMGILSPIAFVIASLIVYWSGWQTVSWLLGSQILLGCVYVISKMIAKDRTIYTNLKSGAWLMIYYSGIIMVSAMGDFGGWELLPHAEGLIAVTIVALISYFIGVNTGLSPVTHQLEDHSLIINKYPEKELVEARV